MLHICAIIFIDVSVKSTTRRDVQDRRFVYRRIVSKNILLVFVKLTDNTPSLFHRMLYISKNVRIRSCQLTVLTTRKLVVKDLFQVEKNV